MKIRQVIEGIFLLLIIFSLFGGCGNTSNPITGAVGVTSSQQREQDGHLVLVLLDENLDPVKSMDVSISDENNENIYTAKSDCDGRVDSWRDGNSQLLATISVRNYRLALVNTTQYTLKYPNNTYQPSLVSENNHNFVTLLKDLLHNNLSTAIP